MWCFGGLATSARQLCVLKNSFSPYSVSPMKLPVQPMLIRKELT